MTSSSLISYCKGCFKELLYVKYLEQYIHFRSSYKKKLEIVVLPLETSDSKGWNQLLSKHTQERNVKIQNTAVLKVSCLLG